jgi:hypothetical protein
VNVFGHDYVGPDVKPVLLAGTVYRVAHVCSNAVFAQERTAIEAGESKRVNSKRLVNAFDGFSVRLRHGASVSLVNAPKQVWGWHT